MHSKVTSPEGAPAFREVARGRVVSGRPPGMSKRQWVECFRASGDKPKTQGKPWAKLSRPFGPEPLPGNKNILIPPYLRAQGFNP